MQEAVVVVKDQMRAEIGRRAMQKRWSDPSVRRRVNIADLTVPQRGLVLALIEAVRSFDRKAIGGDDDAA